MTSSQDLPQNDVTGPLSEEQSKQFKCVNRLCKHGDELREAMEKACTYYNVEYKLGTQICTQCFNAFQSHYEKLMKKWDFDECPLETKFPNVKLQTESSSSSEDEVQPHTNSNNIGLILNESIKKWFDVNKSKLHEYLTMCDDDMSGTCEKYSDNVNELKELYCSAELQADKRRAELRKPCTSKYEYLPPVDLALINHKRASEDISDKQYKKGKLDANLKIIKGIDCFFAGIIGEPPEIINKFRNSIFFENDNVEYRSHKDIRLIVHKTINEVWDAVSPTLKDFLQNYFEKYPEHQMLKLSELDSIKAKFKNLIEEAKVIEIDESLVKQHFIKHKVYEWLYRGFLRLFEIFEKLRKSKKDIRTRQLELAISAIGLNKPIIESTSVEETELKCVNHESTMKPSTSSQSDKSPKRNSNTKIKNSEDIITLEAGKTVPKTMIPHDCNHLCVEWTAYEYKKNKQISMLAIPLNFGFLRMVDSNGLISYTTPCGKNILKIEDMHEYLLITQSKMTIDQFEFDKRVNPLGEFRDFKSKIVKNDLSDGKEFKKITCVNAIDNESPPPIVYMTSRLAMPGVNINVDSDFLCGCDCTDGCQDKSKCACWQMTIEGKNVLPNYYKDSYIGYYYRRLPEHVPTGIYECNNNCKCSSSCLNRVVQNPVSQKLQLFFTEQKGWGVRCLHDIPKGSFICTYVGNLLTEADADESGLKNGDEYFADLDFIECVENKKEYYESEVSFNDEENKDSYETDESFEINDSSDENYRSTYKGKSVASDISLRSRKHKEPQKDTKETKKKCVISKLNDTKTNSNPSKSMREYFGKNESLCVIDAKKSGNIGRYLNHSCDPNTFVQNVFVDTHDLRFPWISFFAKHFIEAGAELTWDYDYEVGSVPEKSMECHCGSSRCRGRLL